jgi:hypothetical protein
LEHGVVDLLVGGALGSRALDIRGRDVPAALLYLPRDVQQRFQFRRHGRGLVVALHRLDDVVVAVERVGGRGAVAGGKLKSQKYKVDK